MTYVTPYSLKNDSHNTMTRFNLILCNWENRLFQQHKTNKKHVSIKQIRRHFTNKPITVFTIIHKLCRVYTVKHWQYSESQHVYNLLKYVHLLMDTGNEWNMHRSAATLKPVSMLRPIGLSDMNIKTIIKKGSVRSLIFPLALLFRRR